MPSTIPSNWLEWTGWSCKCSLYYASAANVNLPNLDWQTCAVGTVPDGTACRELAYPTLGEPEDFRDLAIAVDDATPYPVIQFKVRGAPGGTRHILAFNLLTNEPVSALAQPSVEDCTNEFEGTGEFFLGGFANSRHVLRISERAVKNSSGFPNPTATSGAWLTYDGSEGPPVIGYRVEGDDPDFPREVKGTVLGVLERRKMLHFVPWGGESVIVKPGLSFGPDFDTRVVPLPNGDVLFPGTPGSAWSPTAGFVTQLLGAPVAPMFDFRPVTDGVDLVWVRAAGTPPQQQFTMMAAPYSLDPASVQAGIHAVLPTGMGSSGPLSVGCGHAVQNILKVYEGGKGSAIEVVRLADGASWRLPGGAGNPGDTTGDVWSWEPFFIDCSEVFLRRKLTLDQYRYFRVRLDSLGAPTFPN